MNACHQKGNESEDIFVFNAGLYLCVKFFYDSAWTENIFASLRRCTKNLGNKML